VFTALVCLACCTVKLWQMMQQENAWCLKESQPNFSSYFTLDIAWNWNQKTNVASSNLDPDIRHVREKWCWTWVSLNTNIQTKFCFKKDEHQVGSISFTKHSVIKSGSYECREVICGFSRRMYLLTFVHRGRTLFWNERGNIWLLTTIAVVPGNIMSCKQVLSITFKRWRLLDW